MANKADRSLWDIINDEELARRTAAGVWGFNEKDATNKDFGRVFTSILGTNAQRLGLGFLFGGPAGSVVNTALTGASQGITQGTGAASGELNRALQESNLPGNVKTGLSGAATGLDAFETAQRGVNTAVAGTVMNVGGIVGANPQLAAFGAATMLANQYTGMLDRGNPTSANPLFRDGISTDDVVDTYKQVWDNRVTPGQAISLNFGRNALNFADFITDGESQKKVNEWIIEDSRKKLDDPNNKRGMLSWASGLHSEFDIYDEQQRVSAFNQGVGRWVTGASDAAILWWAAPDIIVAKGASMVGRKLFTEAITSFDDVAKVSTDIAIHQAYRRGEKTVMVDGVEVKTGKTAVGRLVEDLAKIEDEAVAVEHSLAKMSSNKTLVAQVITEAKSPEEMSVALRAMLGDLKAMDEVRATFSAIVADGIILNADRMAKMREFHRLGNELQTVDRFGVTPARADILRRQQDEILRQDEVLKEMIEQNAELAAAVSSSKGAFSTTGISAVRFGTQSKRQAIRLSKFEGGINSPRNMRMKAQKAARIKSGKLFSEKSFKTPGGRVIRVLRSAADYWTTYRAMGRVQIGRNSDDLYDEIASIITTNPVFRRFMRLAPDQRYLPNVDKYGKDVGGFEDIDAFREYWLGRAVQASSSTERLQVAQEFQAKMLAILRSEYGVSAREARQLVQQYKNKRAGLTEMIERNGWFNDGEDIVVVPDLQSQMGETIEIMDFDFIENIFRLEKGGEASHTLSSLKGVGNSGMYQRARMSYGRGLIANIDAVWRPLVLMRLGYTQRNVVEGMLRELAAYGSLGILIDRDMAIKADPNMKAMERLGYRVNQFSNSFIPTFLSPTKRGLKKHTESLRKQQAQLTQLRGEVEAREIMVQRAQAVVDKIAERAQKQARKNLTREAKDRARAYASATMEDTEDLSLGQVTEMMDNATEIVIPAQYVQPLYQTKGGRSSKSVSGFEDELDAELQPVVQGQDGQLDSLDSYMGMDEVTYASMSKWLPEESRQRLAQVIYSEPGTPEYEEYLDLLVDASFAATDHAGRRGFAVVRIRGDGRYDVIQSKDEITIGDLETGNIAVIPKDNFGEVQFIRARVYGDVLDLRYLLDEPSPRISTDPKRVPDQYRSVDEVLESFWVDPTESGLDESLAEELTEYALDVIAQNPDLIRAVNLGRAIIRLKRSHPEIYELAKQKGLLSYGKELKKAIDRARKAGGTAKERQEAWILERDAFLERMDDPEFLETLPELEDWVTGQGEDLMFHGGRIEGDVVDAPAVTEASVGNLHGSAYLYATAAQWMGAEYIVVKSIVRDAVDEPKLYMVTHPYRRENFIDMDGYFIDPETGLPNRDVDEDAAKWFDSVLQQTDEFDDPFEEALDEIHFIMQEMTDRKAFFLGGTPEPLTMKNFREAMEQWILQKRLASPDDAYPPEPSVEDIYAAQELIREGALAMGAVGLRHKGGKNMPSVVKGETEHDVYVYYVEPEVEPIESLTPEIMRLRSVQAKYEKAEQAAAGRTGVVQFYENFAPYNLNKWDASDMTPRTMDILTELANEAGYGSVIVTDAVAPSGRRVIARPDQMTVGVDNPDDVIPGKMLEKDYIDRVFPELQHANLLENSSVYTGRDVDELTALTGNREAAEWIVSGGKKPGELSTEARAAIARAMEPTETTPGYSHVSVGEAGKVYSVSQIMGGKKFGSVYGATLDKDEVTQEAVRLLKANRNWDDSVMELQENTREYQDLLDQVEQAEEAAKKIAEKLKKLNKKVSRKTPNRGFGKERFAARVSGSNEFTMDGPFEDSLYADLASSEQRNRYIILGLSDAKYRDMVRGSKEVEFQPGDELYFTKVSEALNRFYRRDPVAMMFLQRPELLNDNLFVDALPDMIEELRKTERGRAWLRDQGGVEEFKGLVDQEILNDSAFDQAFESIDKVRVDLQELLPDDPDLWRKIADQDVSTVDLMSDAGWRSDWGNYKDVEMIKGDESGYRRVIAKAMRTLGTVPEDHLIRHPFFRARWREDMQRQVDLYATQKRNADPNWDGYFTDNELNQMSLVSKQYALKATNETLYTIQRISTPAHLMKFISPFFPAWASTARFWMLRMPMQKPENVIRYSYIFDSPAAIGALEDREGNKIERTANPLNRVLTKFESDDEKQIVIQATGGTKQWMEDNGIPLTRVGISRGSLDMMLQGDTFWLPGFGPMLTLPLNWAAGLRPDLAEAFKTGNVTNGVIPMVDNFVSNSGLLSSLTRAAYDSTLPFGPSKEKDIFDLAIESFAPGAAANAIKKMRGTDSASFSNTAQSIYRDKIYEWDRNGRVGPKPNLQESAAEAQVFYWWRIGISLSAPFAPQFQSENQVYVNEWRAILNETFDSGGTYSDAVDRFIGSYGKEFFAFTQSLSAGSSGVSAKVGEYKEVTGNMDLYSGLAAYGDDASYMTMASRGVADWSYDPDGFDPAVYAWQFNRSIEGASGKFFRSGSNQRTDMLQDVDKQAGWYYYNKTIEPYMTLYEAGEIDQDTYIAIKDIIVGDLGKKYPSWYDEYGNNSKSRNKTSARALEDIVTNEQYMTQHGGTTYAQAILQFRNFRNEVIQELLKRDAAGGSASIDAKSNADLALAYRAWVYGLDEPGQPRIASQLRAIDPTMEAYRMVDRFFGENDSLTPIPGKDY